MDGKISTYYHTKTDKLVQQDEVVLIDSHRSLRLPSYVFEKFKGLSMVKVVVNDDNIELIPFETNE